MKITEFTTAFQTLSDLARQMYQLRFDNSSLHHYMTSIKISVGFELQQHASPTPSIFEWMKNRSIRTMELLFLMSSYHTMRLMTSSLTHYFVCHKSQNFDPQECVHNNSSRKVGGGRRYVQFSHQKWANDILLTCPRFKPSQGENQGNYNCSCYELQQDTNQSDWCK